MAKKHLFPMLILIAFISYAFLPRTSIPTLTDTDFKELGDIYLTFNKISKDSANDSATLKDSSFSKTKDPMELLTQFSKRLNTIEDAEAQSLFVEFTRLDLWRRISDSSTAMGVARRWVEMAKSEESFQKQILYSRYKLPLRSVPRVHFYGQRGTVRPQTEVKISAYSGRVSHKADYMFEKLNFDGIKPVDFTKIDEGEIFFTNRWNSGQLSLRLEDIGVYRVTITTKTEFEQFFIQASYIDALTKSDNEKIILSISNPNGFTQKPFVIHAISPYGEVQRVESGSPFLKINHNLELDSSEAVKFIIEKEGDLAFIHGFMPSTPNNRPLIYTYTDRPVYRPGDSVRIEGIVRELYRSKDLVESDVDTLLLTVRNSSWEEILSREIAIDSWGHFADSLQLPDDAKQGEYSIRVSHRDNRRGFHQGGDLSFHVNAYRKPEFKIEFGDLPKRAPADSALDITVQSNYYFGAPLTDAELRVRYYSNPSIHFPHPFGRAIHHFHRPQRVLISEEEHKLSTGKLILNYSPKIEEDQATLTIEVTVVDQSRREVTSSKDILIYRSPTVISLQTDRYNYSLGQEVQIQASALSLDSKPHQVPFSFRVKTSNTIVLDTTVRADGNGEVNLKFKPDEVGDYRVELSLRDGNNRVRYRETGFSVSREDRSHWERERVELSLDKERYSPGDTATISIRTSTKAARAHAIIEGDRVHSAFPVDISNYRGEIRVEVDPEWGLNARLSLYYSSPTRLAQSSVTIPIFDSSHLAIATLSGENSLRPGDRYSGVLTLRDIDGSPIIGNFTIALVDESIFDVAKNLDRFTKTERTILDIFPRHFHSSVRTALNRFDLSFLLSIEESDSSEDAVAFGGVADEAVSAPMAMRSASKEIAFSAMDSAPTETGSATAEEETSIREDFRDIGWWQRDITTDSTGSAYIEFPLPDNITKWRVLLRGSDGSSRLIHLEDSIITKLPIISRLILPRAVVEGDSLLVTLLSHNYTDTTLKVSTKLVKGEDAVATSLQQIVSPNSVKRRDIPFNVTDEDSLSLKSVLTSNSGSDGEIRTIPVLVNGIEDVRSWSGVLEKGSKKLHLYIEDSWRDDSRTLTLKWSPTLALTLFESLDYLTGYPYGCVEQTLNRFLPNLYVARALGRLERSDDSLLNKISTYTDSGLVRLELLQNFDGSWGWWGRDNFDPRMTSLVVEGLTYAVESTLLSDSQRATAERLIIKALPSLRANLNNKNLALGNRLLIASALTPHRDSSDNLKEMVREVHRKRGQLPISMLAPAIELASELKLHRERDALLDLLLSAVHQSNGRAYWDGSREFRWFSQREETTARALKMLLTVDPQNPLVSESARWLAGQRQNGYWISTKTTASVLEALSLYIDQSSELKPDYKIGITLNGQTILEKTITGDSIKGEQTIVISDGDIGSGDLEIVMDGIGKFYYSADLRWIKDEQPIKPLSNGFKISREYHKLSYKRSRDGDWELVREPIDSVVKSGDEIEVTVNISLSNPQEYVLIEDFFPSGMEVTKPENEWINRWNWWWRGTHTHSEARDDRMVWFARYLSKGEHSYTYLLRAETPGRFTALPARAECMYEPEIRGYSSSEIFNINGER